MGTKKAVNVTPSLEPSEGSAESLICHSGCDDILPDDKRPRCPPDAVTRERLRAERERRIRDRYVNLQAFGVKHGYGALEKNKQFRAELLKWAPADGDGSGARGEGGSGGSGLSA